MNRYHVNYFQLNVAKYLQFIYSFLGAISKKPWALVLCDTNGANYLLKPPQNKLNDISSIRRLVPSSQFLVEECSMSQSMEHP